MSPLASTNEEAIREIMTLPVGGWNAADLGLAREGLGMTQAELAAAIGYDRSAIAKIEGGDTAPRLVVELAVRYLVDHRAGGPVFKAKGTPEVARFQSAEIPLGVSDSGFPQNATTDIFLAKGPAVWFRLMPEFKPDGRLSVVEIKKVATQNGFPLVQLIDGYSDLGFVRGTDGFGVFGIVGDRSIAPAVSYVFESGEIWSIDTYLIDAIKRHAREAKQGLPGIPYLEDRFKYAAHLFRVLLSRLGLRPPFRWIAGLEGVKDTGLYFPAPAGRYFPVPIPHGRCLIDAIWDTGLMNESDTPATALKPFFEKMFNAFAVERPEYLDHLSNPQ